MMTLLLLFQIFMVEFVIFPSYPSFIDLLRVPPGFKAGMDFTDKSKISYFPILKIRVGLKDNHLIIFFI